jgi:hypothetical protein
MEVENKNFVVVSRTKWKKIYKDVEKGERLYRRLLTSQQELLNHLEAIKIRNSEKMRIKKKVNVERIPGRDKLSFIIHRIMPFDKILSSNEVLDLVIKSGYKTNSNYLAGMVNNKLNQDKEIQKVSRGKFILISRKRKAI